MPEVPPVPLAQLTTLRTGGTPERLLVAEHRDNLVATVRSVWSQGQRWMLLGGGSNVFVGDEPFNGVVVLARSSGIEELPGTRQNTVRLRVQAGHDWDSLVEYAVHRGLAGIEAMSGIPGTVGAAPVQNIGAYGQDLSQTLVEVEFLDEALDAVVIVPVVEMGLGFRTSIFKHHYGSDARRPGVILSVTLELEVAGHHDLPVRSGQLRSALALNEVGSAGLRHVRTRVLELRRATGMIWDPSDPDSYSVGSFFQNAIVSRDFVNTLPPECPRWSLSPDRDSEVVIPVEQYRGIVPVQAGDTPDYKLSSAWLIEHAGVPRGFHLPHSRAAVSSKHALALINSGDGSAAEIAELARYVRLRVESEFGLRLHVEPMLVGVEI